MEPAEWQRIKSLFLEAREKARPEQSAFLEEECGSDENIRHEVESLLAHEDLASSFLESEAAAVVDTGRPNEELPVGEQVGPYTITALIGAGGMGQVYKAHDQRLDRYVAIKFLSSGFADDAELQHRFQREARAASALNHPNICTIHDVGEFHGRPYLLLELLEGQSLKERLSGDRMTAGEIVTVGRQVCSALQAAHEKAIVHRDIKPANIFLLHRGGVKVLDFGLAKRGMKFAPPSGSHMKIKSAGLTISGKVMGTLAYMSPEQAVGNEVDARSDIFSLGIVLYEMATGHAPFRGKTAAGIIGSILTESPVKPSSITSAAGGKLERTILKALEKEPADRYQSAADLSADLTLALTAARTRRIRWIAAGALAMMFWLAWGLLPNPRRSVGNGPGAQAAISQEGLAWWNQAGATAGLNSLAVLPFRDLAGHPDANYISDGFTESLIGELSKIGSLRVISRASVMRYRNEAPPMAQIASELDAKAVLNGSIAHVGDRLRISIQLFDASKNQQVWSKTYERDWGEVLKLWEDIAVAIAQEIRVRVLPEERTRLTSRAVKREAFEAYLRGRHFWNKRTLADINKAIEFFRKAIDEDPAYARAYAGLADCYNQLGTVLIGELPPAETRPLAIAAAKKALEIDPELGEAQATLAYCRLYDWEWNTAAEGFQRAIQLNPSYAPAHLWYSHYLSMRLRHDEALREVRLANQLDPLSSIIRTQLGWILQNATLYDEAIRELSKVLETDPNYLWALWRIGTSYKLASRLPESIAALEKAAAVSNRSPSILGNLAESYGLAGRRAEAQKVLVELLAVSRRQYVPSTALAHAYRGVGDDDGIFESLEKAYRDREHGTAWLATWDPNDSHRKDTRFLELIRRVGLPAK